MLRPLDLAWSASNPATSFPWSQVNGLAPFDWRDPRSPFDGAQRDFYLNQLKLHPTGTEGGVVFTDPYGGSATDAPFHGSIRQLIRPGTVLGEVDLARQKFDTNADFGDGNGVHAPN